MKADADVIKAACMKFIAAIQGKVAELEQGRLRLLVFFLLGNVFSCWGKIVIRKRLQALCVPSFVFLKRKGTEIEHWDNVLCPLSNKSHSLKYRYPK
jgi:hypothetical protein